jgi:hypothetical protein
MVALSQGSDITAASTISVTHDVHKITGTTTINTINPPSPSFKGMVILLMAGGQISDSGNVLRVIDSQADRMYTLYYDPSVSKWYPV